MPMLAKVYQDRLFISRIAVLIMLYSKVAFVSLVPACVLSDTKGSKGIRLAVWLASWLALGLACLATIYHTRRIVCASII